MCEYKFRDGKRCKEEALPNSDYCILHIDLPEDEESDEFKRINELKEGTVREKVNKGDFNFEGAKLFEVDFSGMEIKNSLTFVNAVIKRTAFFNVVQISRNASFYGAKIGYASFHNAKIGGDASFHNTKIGGGVSFYGAEIDGAVFFPDAEIGGGASFDEAEIGGDAWFMRAKIRGAASFDKAKIRGNALFYDVEIGGDASFREAEIDNDTSFNRAKIGGNAWFMRAKIGGLDASFSAIQIIGEMNFKDATFKFPKPQEEACRTARKTQERIGDRVSADYHFYREMEAKRKRKYKTYSLKPILKLIRKLKLEKLISKHINFFEAILKLMHKLGLKKLIDKPIYDKIVYLRGNTRTDIELEFFEKKISIYWGFLELPVQYIFGYGVHPWRVIATWLLTVFSLAFVYWLGNGVEAADSLVECIYFSVVTAATPGYGGYRPNPGFYQGLASFEAVFGTFMWAAFIATFARKYMR